MNRWIICDIDGTIADNARRVHLVPDWDAFHADMENDPPYEHVVNLIHILDDADYAILFLTGRPEKYRPQTRQWLDSYGLYHECLMRPDDNYMKAPDLKWKILCERFGGEEGVKKNVFMVIEDQDRIVEAFRNHGLFVIQPRLGDY